MHQAKVNRRSISAEAYKLLKLGIEGEEERAIERGDIGFGDSKKVRRAKRLMLKLKEQNIQRIQYLRELLKETR